MRKSIFILKTERKTKRYKAYGGEIRIYNDNEVRDEVYCNEYELEALEIENDCCFEEDE